MTRMTGSELAERIRQLSQGTSTGMIHETPARRGNKNRSGRQGRKQYAGRVTLRKVGGYSNWVRASYAPADKEMCVVVPKHTGMRDGVPFRSPGLHFQG